MSKWVLEPPSAAKPLRTARMQQERLLVACKTEGFEKNILLLDSSWCISVLVSECSLYLLPSNILFEKMIFMIMSLAHNS